MSSTSGKSLLQSSLNVTSKPALVRFVVKVAVQRVSRAALETSHAPIRPLAESPRAGCAAGAGCGACADAASGQASTRPSTAANSRGVEKSAAGFLRCIRLFYQIVHAGDIARLPKGDVANI